MCRVDLVSRSLHSWTHPSLSRSPEQYQLDSQDRTTNIWAKVWGKDTDEEEIHLMMTKDLRHTPSRHLRLDLIPELNVEDGRLSRRIV
jgi:hypothetical protein